MLYQTKVGGGAPATDCMEVVEEESEGDGEEGGEDEEDHHLPILTSNLTININLF